MSPGWRPPKGAAVTNEGAEFLRAWHARFPGSTSAAFFPGRIVDDGRSSYAMLVDDVADLPDAKTVVDLGCGDGKLLELLAEQRPQLQLIGIDTSPEELALARVRNLPENVRLVEADAAAMPLDDASADAAVCHMALMLFDNVSRVVAELARVIRPNGLFAAVLGPAPGNSELVAWYGARLHEAEALENLAALRVGDPATNEAKSLRALFTADE